VGETFGVNTDGMTTAASALNDVVNRLGGVYSSTAQQLPDPGSALGDPGKDPIAAAVNDNFLPGVWNFLSGVKNAVTVLGQAGDGVGTMVHGFDETEQENADSIRPSGPDTV
jgi:hypothetical protein